MNQVSASQNYPLYVQSALGTEHRQVGSQNFTLFRVWERCSICSMATLHIMETCVPCLDCLALGYRMSWVRSRISSYMVECTNSRFYCLCRYVNAAWEDAKSCKSKFISWLPSIVLASSAPEIYSLCLPPPFVIVGQTKAWERTWACGNLNHNPASVETCAGGATGSFPGMFTDCKGFDACVYGWRPCHVDASQGNQG